MLQLVNFGNKKLMPKTGKIIEILAHGYSSECTQRELSNEYQHDRVKMVLKLFCILVLWTKKAPASEGLTHNLPKISPGGKKLSSIVQDAPGWENTNFHESSKISPGGKNPQQR